MLKNLKSYYRVKNLREGLSILKKSKGKVVPLGGATTLSVLNAPEIEGLLELENLGLSYIREDKDKIRIGSMTRISDLFDSKIIEKFADGFLKKVAITIGSTLNRNMITVGGNIYQIYLWSSLPPALLCLDAKIKVKSLNSSRTIKAEEFFSKIPRKILSYDEIITEIEIDKKNFRGVKAEFVKFSKTKTAYPVISVGVIVKKTGSMIKDLRVAVGSLSILPQRFKDIEKIYIGKNIDEKNAFEFASKIVERAKVVNDIRATANYKKEVTKNLIKDILISI